MFDDQREAQARKDVAEQKANRTMDNGNPTVPEAVEEAPVVETPAEAVVDAPVETPAEEVAPATETPADASAPVETPVAETPADAPVAEAGSTEA